MGVMSNLESQNSNLKSEICDLKSVQHCPKCGAPWAGPIETSPPHLDCRLREWQAQRAFPCFHCQIIVCWFQACSRDGALIDHPIHRRDFGYLIKRGYTDWLAKRPRFAALEMEAA
jgi:hypothetical protein